MIGELRQSGYRTREAVERLPTLVDLIHEVHVLGELPCFEAFKVFNRNLVSGPAIAAVSAGATTTDKIGVFFGLARAKDVVVFVVTRHFFLCCF